MTTRLTITAEPKRLTLVLEQIDPGPDPAPIDTSGEEITAVRLAFPAPALQVIDGGLCAQRRVG